VIVVRQMDDKGRNAVLSAILCSLKVGLENVAPYQFIFDRASCP